MNCLKLQMRRVIRVKISLKSLSGLKFLSYRHNCGEYPLIYQTLGQNLDEAAKRFGERTAFISYYENKKLSFQEVKEKTDEFASGLVELGLSPGDRVGLWSQNSMEWLLASIAIAKAGMISVYLNPSYEALEMKQCLSKVGVKTLITAESFREKNFLKILEEIDPAIMNSQSDQINSKVLPDLKSIVCISKSDVPGTIPFSSLPKKITEKSKEKLKNIQKTFTPEDPCNIQFTSGTTGSPKGAVLNHFNLVNNAIIMAKRQQLHLKEHIMCFMGPLFHAMGSVIGMVTCFQEGSTFLIPDAAFNSSTAAEAIIKEKSTILLGTPTMYIDVMNVMTAKNLRATTPEFAICGGAYASSSLFSDMLEKLNIKRIVSVYGLTETGPVVFMSKIGDTLDKQLSTVGYIMDNIEVKVVDEKGFVVPFNTPGELYVRGYSIMKGYWNDPKKTEETITADHWIKTGDKFILLEDGYGKIVGRIKDMIIRGGENIFPAEIEEFLSSYPEIVDVQVVGVPDQRLGEQVCACVLLQPGSQVTAAQLQEFCKGKIAAFKIPKYILFFDKFPKTSSGKIQKYKLKVEAMERLQLKEN